MQTDGEPSAPASQAPGCNTDAKRTFVWGHSEASASNGRSNSCFNSAVSTPSFSSFQPGGNSSSPKQPNFYTKWKVINRRQPSSSTFVGKHSDRASAYGNGCHRMCDAFATQAGQTGFGAESIPFSFGADAAGHSLHMHRFAFGVSSQHAPSRQQSATEGSGAGVPSTFRFTASGAPQAVVDDASHTADTMSCCSTLADTHAFRFSFDQAHCQQTPMFPIGNVHSSAETSSC